MATQVVIDHAGERLPEHDDWSGYVPTGPRRRRDPDWEKRVADFLEFMDSPQRRAWPTLWRVKLEETMGQADFPNLLGDSLVRLMIPIYKGMQRVLDPIFQAVTVPDFRTAKVFRAEGTLERLPVVGEGGPYQEATRSETKYEVTLAKYGRVFDINMELLLGDDIGFFETVPTELAEAAIHTESWKMSSQFWTSTGANTDYFAHATEGAGAVSSNTLTIANLYAARAAMLGQSSGYRNVAGEPIQNAPGYLVVPPYLEAEARQILESTEVRWTESAGGSASQRGTLNVAQRLGISLIVDPWIPVIVTSGTVAQTCWALFSKVGKAGAIARLRGAETPQVYRKITDQEPVGGGAAALPFDVGFEDDKAKWKVMHAIGGTTLDPRRGWASNGQ